MLSITDIRFSPFSSAEQRENLKGGHKLQKQSKESGIFCFMVRLPTRGKWQCDYHCKLYWPAIKAITFASLCRAS